MEKKKIPKKRIAIIAIIAAVVLIAAGVLLYGFLAPQKITGDWELVVNPEISRATPDEVEDSDRVYYSFSEPDSNGEGTYKTYFDGGVEEGKYALSEKGSKKFINMGTEDLEYTITGSKLFGSAKLTITYPEQKDEETGVATPAQDYVFVREKSPEYEKESYRSYQTDTALSGEWKTDERTLSYYVYDLSYTQTVRFSDSGVMTIHYESADLVLDRVMYYAYTAEGGMLTFSPVTDKETKFTVPYRIDGSGNLLFTDDNTTASIFADAFFGDVTYYPVITP